MTREQVLEKVSKKREEFISWYHEFHQIPELGFEEKETTELICEKLTGMGIHPLRLDPTGVTAYIGPHDAYTVGLRADIDGLRVLEDTDLPFQSKHPGKMHACGHDFILAAAPSLAKIIAEEENDEKKSCEGQKEYEPMEVQLDLTGLQREIKLELVSTAETKRAVVINPEWSAKTVEE